MELVELLNNWNADLLKDEDIEQSVDASLLKAKWLGRAAATEDELSAVESRLGVPLPKSYREFLLIANGWAYSGNDMDFPGPLRSSDEVCWFRDEDMEWIEAWTSADGPTVPDDEYLTYGEEQDPASMRPEYLSKCLKISEVTEGGVYLLNPEVKSKDGEWKAWHFSDNLPGATRCKSFRDLIRQQMSLLRQYRA